MNNVDSIINFIMSNPFLEAMFFAILAIFVLKVAGMALKMAFSVAIAIGAGILIYAFSTGSSIDTSLNDVIIIAKNALAQTKSYVISLMQNIK